MRKLYWVAFLGFVMTLCMDSYVFAQGLQSSPYSAPSLLRRDSLSLVPPNAFDPARTNCRGPTGSEIPLLGTSSRKDIPNLQGGYVYYSDKNWRAGYYTLDYVLPIRLGEDSIIFGEAHSELLGFSTKSIEKADDQLYLSMGGGYRTILRRTTLIGLNCFYDAARYANQWLSSWGAGFEMAALLYGHDAVDINANWYGDLSNDGALVNESRDGLDNFYLQAGYSHQLFDGGPDLRLYGTAYKFDDGGGVWGWQAGMELKSANGVLSAKCETAYDPANDSYQTVSAFLNVGFQLENLLRGRNPFVTPEPLFNSPRNFSRLTDNVDRHWRHTTHGVLLASNSQTITVVNKRSAPVTLYMGFIGPVGWGKYSSKDFPDFSVAPSSCNAEGNILYRSLKPGEQVVINFDPKKGQVSPAFSADQCTWNCPQTIAEFTLQGWQGDWMDISLVNGFNYPMEIGSSGADMPPIRVGGATGNKNKAGVYPLKCDLCNDSDKPGCGMPRDPTDCSPNNACHMLRPYGANYVVSILPN
ncbi:MAG: thaumatin family protein [Deltaproteobacteria bacterium]|nr:thaumatin family protein [Deltaproteobacteria bacterium]